MTLTPPATQVVPDLLAPTGFMYSTFARGSYANTAAAPTTGVLYMSAVALPAGFSVGRIAFMSSSVAAVTPTNWWFGLYDSSRVQLATTANQTTTAWAATTLKNLTVATTAAGASTSFTTTYTGLYYVGFLMTAATMVNLMASNPSSLSTTAPLLAGASTTGLTAPPAFPTTATAITASGSMPYAAVGA